MNKCNDCGLIFEDAKFFEIGSGRDYTEWQGCPNCKSEDYSEYDEGFEAFNSTQRCPHEKVGWEDEE